MGGLDFEAFNGAGCELGGELSFGVARRLVHGQWTTLWMCNSKAESARNDRKRSGVLNQKSEVELRTWKVGQYGECFMS